MVVAEEHEVNAVDRIEGRTAESQFDGGGDAGAA